MLANALRVRQKFPHENAFIIAASLKHIAFLSTTNCPVPHENKAKNPFNSATLPRFTKAFMLARALIVPQTKKIMQLPWLGPPPELPFLCACSLQFSGQAFPGDMCLFTSSLDFGIVRFSLLLDSLLWMIYFAIRFSSTFLCILI